MALPAVNNQSGGVAPNTTAMGNTGLGMGAAGIANYTNLQQQNTQQQKIKEILSNIEARLSNITNLRTQAQSSLYDTFGNNFITRGAVNLSDSIVETIQTLFAEEEEKKEDPLVQSIKKIEEAITKISNQQGMSGSGNGNVIDLSDLIDLNKQANSYLQDIQMHITNQSDLLQLTHDANKNLDEIRFLMLANKDLLTDMHTDDKVFQNMNISLLEDLNATATKQVEMLKNLGGGNGSNKPPILSDTITDEQFNAIFEGSDFVNTVPTGQHFDVDLSDEDSNSLVRSPKQADNKPVPVKDTPAISLLSTINSTLTSIFKSLTSFVSSNTKLTNQESDLESVIASGRQSMDSSETVSGKNANKILSALSKIQAAEGIGGVIAGVLAGIGTIITFFSGSKILNAVKAIATAAASFIGIDKLLDKFKTPTASTGTGLPTNTPTTSSPNSQPVPGNRGASIGARIAQFAKTGFQFAKSYAIPALLAVGAVNIVDSVVADAGFGNNKIDEVQDEKNWARMSFLQKLGSSIDRGVEHAADIIGLDAIANEARSSRIQKETSYLDENLNDIDQSLKQIQQKQEELLMNSKTSTITQQPQPSKNTVLNNQTFIPIRESVKNTDESLNRYLTSVLA